jgi:hypothetical protein
VGVSSKALNTVAACAILPWDNALYDQLALLGSQLLRISQTDISSRAKDNCVIAA